MTATEQYIEYLTRMKSGELGLLRQHAGQGLDETVDGFDLFAGLWWPLRAKSERTPRREVAWLIAKLYAFRPIPQAPGEMLARQLARCQPNKGPEKKRFSQRFDRMLTRPLGKIEPHLRWALNLLASKDLKLDWIKLTDDLSIWERESKRLEWANQFLKTCEGGQPC
ncbi:MAG: type I-E CRISPR-associated protein Cse2/CasB [Chloroflexi bacterium]|nr:type I-E CRISPR-associated protein Cse2/CasB [Deltaproteobacteria bacterium]MCX6036543.1 type I-E CRISPR-associated protein Cse2/CasB [Chloroflexota bacterium]